MPADEFSKRIRRNENETLELKSSVSRDEDFEDLLEAACAFANDFPGNGVPGLAVVGVGPDLEPSGEPITEDLMQRLEDVRNSPHFTPRLVTRVYSERYAGSEVAVLEVAPSLYPPVRFKGRTCIRVRQRRAHASDEEEERLRERVPAAHRPFDARPCQGATVRDIDLETVLRDYLPRVLTTEVAEEDARDPEVRLQNVSLFDSRSGFVTNAAVLCFGLVPWTFVSGAEVQYSRFDGPNTATAPKGTQVFTGTVPRQLNDLELFLKGPNPDEPSPDREPGPGFEADFPAAAMRELVVNAVVHRAYDGTNSPTRIMQFSDRVEIVNPGGLFGVVRPDSFGSLTDYRNPHLASILRAFEFVERSGTGIPRARAELRKNGNPPPRFDLEDPAWFRAVVLRRSPT